VVGYGILYSKFGWQGEIGQRNFDGDSGGLFDELALFILIHYPFLARFEFHRAGWPEGVCLYTCAQTGPRLASIRPLITVITTCQIARFVPMFTFFTMFATSSLTRYTTCGIGVLFLVFTYRSLPQYPFLAKTRADNFPHFLMTFSAVQRIAFTASQLGEMKWCTHNRGLI
jgi:hypothetical protein